MESPPLSLRSLAFVLLGGAAACGGDDTCLLIEVDSDVALSGPLEVDVSVPSLGASAQRSVTGPLPGTILIHLPASAARATVRVSGVTAAGAPIAASADFDIVPNRCVSGRLALGAAQPDGGADLAGADFAGVDFASGDLANGDFAIPDLAGADFAGVDLTSVDLAHADLATADLSPPADLRPPPDLQPPADLQIPPDMTTPSCATVGAVALCDDFEKAALDTTTWTADAVATIDSTMSHRGSRSLKVHLAAIASGGSGDSTVIETKTFPPAGSNLWVRAWMYLGALPAGANRMQVIGFEQATGSNEGDYFFVETTDYRLYDQFSGNVTPSSVAPPVGSWFCVILQVSLATGNTGSFSLTGSLAPLSQTGEITQGSPPIGRVLLGPFLGSTTSAQPALDVWFDDVIVDFNPLTCAE